MNIFEFSQSFQFTEKEIQEYIDKNNIEDIEQIKSVNVIDFVCKKYQIRGWSEGFLNEEETEERFLNTCKELLSK